MLGLMTTDWKKWELLASLVSQIHTAVTTLPFKTPSLYTLEILSVGDKPLVCTGQSFISYEWCSSIKSPADCCLCVRGDSMPQSTNTVTWV